MKEKITIVAWKFTLLAKKNANDNTNDLFEAKIFEGKSLYEIIDCINDISY